MCELAAEVFDKGTKPEHVLPCSTGIIGHLMPMEKIEAGIRDAGQYLGDSLEHANLFADAILTTDTRRKTAAVEFKAGRETVTIAGVCKGSGMIGPKMALLFPHATMLAFLTTDAKAPKSVLGSLLQEAADESFNAVTVDDHSSTNDTAAILASGASGASVGAPPHFRKFSDALKDVCRSLAYQIAADGEGATKVVVVRVRGTSTKGAARVIARAIANSPLVKCAMHGNDPNWGRIVSAAGFSGAKFDPQKATLTLQGTVVFRNGQPIPFDAAALSKALATKEVRVELSCRLGKSEATCWTCDLSKEYVTINADYHT
jgi:glutamate N-acetyltransferase/amino-acid N-acetyltransferase